MGLKVETDMPKMVDLETGEIVPINPDKGFASNPAKENFNPDLSKYPEVLREVVKNHLKNGM